MKIVARIKRLFLKLFGKKGIKELGSTEQTHWVNHIHDYTSFWPNCAAMYGNVHGFEEGEGDGKVYWLGIDIRCFFARTADYLIKFRSKALYDEYAEASDRAANETLKKMLYDQRLNVRRGGDVNIDFIFRWGNEDKHFDVHAAGDAFGEEK